MVILLIPGTILGIAFKTYATCRYHVQEDDVFMKNCLKKGEVGKIFTPKGQSKFGEKILAFIDLLQSKTVNLQNPDFKATSRPFFLSEVRNMKLLIEGHQWNPYGGWYIQYVSGAANINRLILANVHFLWNLSSIYLADHFIASSSPEEAVLKEIKPSVTVFDEPARGLAKDFTASGLLHNPFRF
jgi:hypothetical protein